MNLQIELFIEAIKTPYATLGENYSTIALDTINGPKHMYYEYSHLSQMHLRPGTNSCFLLVSIWAFRLINIGQDS